MALCPRRVDHDNLGPSAHPPVQEGKHVVVELLARGEDGVLGYPGAVVVGSFARADLGDHVGADCRVVRVASDRTAPEVAEDRVSERVAHRVDVDI